MKGQVGFIFALIFAVLVAVFAVLNVDPVVVNYGFVETHSPLVLLILGSVLMGGIIVLLFGTVRLYKLKRQIKELEKENASLRAESENELKENEGETF